MKLTCTTIIDGTTIDGTKLKNNYTTSLSWLCTRGTLYHRYTYGTCDMCTRGTHVYLNTFHFQLSTFKNLFL